LTLVYSTPQQFGAKGDGVTDDTAALQSWLSDASDAQKIALLPPAPGPFYRITSELAVSNVLYLTGAGGGKHATSGSYTSRSQIRQFTPGANGLHLLNAVDSIHIDNVVISAAPAGNYTNDCSGIFFDGGSPDSDCSILDQVLVTGFGTGVNVASAADSSFRGCSFGRNGVGVAVSGVANNITLESCQLSYNYNHQVYATAADNLMIKGSDIAAETPGSQGILGIGNVNLVLIGDRFEDYSTNTMLILGVTPDNLYNWMPQLTAISTKFYNYSHTTRYSIALTNCEWASLIDVKMEAVQASGLGLVVRVPDDGSLLTVGAFPSRKCLFVNGAGTTQIRTATMVDPAALMGLGAPSTQAK